MNILFVSYDVISLERGLIRSAAMLYALADAGHKIDLLAPQCTLPDHPHIRILLEQKGKPLNRFKVRSAGFRAIGRGAYDVIHADGDAVFFARSMCRWKNTRLVYAAQSTSVGGRLGVCVLCRLFPGFIRWKEARVLEKAAVVFSSCEAMTNDLRRTYADIDCVQLEDVPAQSLHSSQIDTDKEPPFTLGKRAGYSVVCDALPGHPLDLRTLFIAVRKVVEAAPDTLFFFRGISRQKAEKIVASLELNECCYFFGENELKPFLAELNKADAILMLPEADGRYIHPMVYTHLHTGAPLVILTDAAYETLLCDRTSVRVLPNSESISEGLLRTMEEPLFSIAIAMEGQQLVVGAYTYSSFKHKIRMTYYALGNPGHSNVRR